MNPTEHRNGITFAIFTGYSEKCWKMRPDQHKQKKSAQYKKKHGIQTKGNVEQERGKGAGAGAKGRGQGKGQSGKCENEADKNGDKLTGAETVPSTKASDEYEQVN